jgi:hypothetical protein
MMRQIILSEAASDLPASPPPLLGLPEDIPPGSLHLTRKGHHSRQQHGSILCPHLPGHLPERPHDGLQPRVNLQALAGGDAAEDLYLPNRRQAEIF